MMSKVLIAYVSRTGKTEKMAEWIAEGVRLSGNEATITKVSDLKDEKGLEGYEGVASVRVSDLPSGHDRRHEDLLFLAEKANLVGKIGGAFGSYTHSGESAPMIFDTMLYVFKMDTVDLGALSLKEALIGAAEGVKACQDYGKAVGQKFHR